MSQLFAAMGLVFLAELGDKTQLVALGFGARHRLGPVLAGVALAYICTNLLSVFVGGLLGAALPTRGLAVAGGVLFLGFALWNLLSGDDAENDDAGDGTTTSDAGSATVRIVFSVAAAMFIAELGDKTMLAVATLAAQGNPVLVWIGATVGIIASGSLGVFVGRATGAALPERAIRIGSAALFAVFGVVLIVTNL